MEQYMVGFGVIGFVVIAAVVIYLIAMFGMRERTFEEVIAEQRRREAETKAKKPEKKDKKKYRKGKGKAEKQSGDEKAEKAGQSEEEEPHKMVELELEPEIIDPVEHPKPEEKKKKEKKQKKSILLNREEKSYMRPGEVSESFHPETLPKDEIELKHEHDTRTPTPEPEVVAPVPTRKEKKREREAKKEQLLQQVEMLVQEEQVQLEEAMPVRSERSERRKKNRSNADYGSGGKQQFLPTIPKSVLYYDLQFICKMSEVLLSDKNSPSYHIAIFFTLILQYFLFYKISVLKNFKIQLFCNVVLCN